MRRNLDISGTGKKKTQSEKHSNDKALFSPVDSDTKWNIQRGHASHSHCAPAPQPWKGLETRIWKETRQPMDSSPTKQGTQGLNSSDICWLGEHGATRSPRDRSKSDLRISLGHCQGLKEIKNGEQSQLHDVWDPVQNKNAGSLILKSW